MVWMHNTACIGHILYLYVIHFKIFLEFEIERILTQSIEWLTELTPWIFFLISISKRVHMFEVQLSTIFEMCAQIAYPMSSAIIRQSWKWYVIFNKLSSCQWKLYVTHSCKFHSQANNSAAAFHGLFSLIWICTKNAHSNVDPLIWMHWNIANLFDVKSLESNRWNSGKPAKFYTLSFELQQCNDYEWQTTRKCCFCAIVMAFILM